MTLEYPKIEEVKKPNEESSLLMLSHHAFEEQPDDRDNLLNGDLSPIKRTPDLTTPKCLTPTLDYEEDLPKLMTFEKL